MVSYVENLPSDEIDFCEEVTQNQLELAAQARIEKASESEIMSALWFNLPSAAATRLLNLLQFSKSFAESNAIVAYLKKNTEEIDVSHINLLFKVAVKNDQVLHCNEILRFLSKVAASHADLRAAVNSAADVHKLPDFTIA